MSVVDSWSLSYARLENLPDQLLLVCCPLLKNSKLILVQETKKFNAFNRNVTCMLANVRDRKQGSFYTRRLDMLPKCRRATGKTDA